jgi:hypothetical protein
VPSAVESKRHDRGVEFPEKQLHPDHNNSVGRHSKVNHPHEQHVLDHGPAVLFRLQLPGEQGSEYAMILKIKTIS